MLTKPNAKMSSQEGRVYCQQGLVIVMFTKRVGFLMARPSCDGVYQGLLLARHCDSNTYLEGRGFASKT